MLEPLQNSRFKKKGGHAYHAGDIEAAGGGGKSSNQRAEWGDLVPDRNGASEAGEKNWTEKGVYIAWPSGLSRGLVPTRLRANRLSSQI